MRPAVSLGRRVTAFVAGASQSMWWLYCQAVFSGLANFIAIGMITSRTRRAMGPAALCVGAGGEFDDACDALAPKVLVRGECLGVRQVA